MKSTNQAQRSNIVPRARSTEPARRMHSATQSRHARMVAQARIPTPMGEMTAAVTDQGLAGLWFDHQSHHPGTFDLPIDANHAHVRAARRWLDAYWRGAPLPAMALDPAGTPFQQAVWRALLAIPLGHTCSYADIAAAVGKPMASRAVGAAVGRNPIGIVVPCHRVVGSNGSLTGYAGGLDRKRTLLAHEAPSGAQRVLVQ